MNTRETTEKFLSLPFYKQFKILQCLSVVKNEDLKLNDYRLFLTCFKRIKEQNKINQLEQHVLEAYSDGDLR